MDVNESIIICKHKIVEVLNASKLPAGVMSLILENLQAQILNKMLENKLDGENSETQVKEDG